MPNPYPSPGYLLGCKGQWLSAEKWPPRREFADLCLEVEVWLKGVFYDCPFDQVPAGALWRPSSENDPRAF